MQSMNREARHIGGSLSSRTAGLQTDVSADKARSLVSKGPYV